VTINDLPAVNATLNAISAVLLVIGYVLIRRKRIQQHRRAMIAAFATSTLFLVCYVIYHANVGSKPFAGQGTIRTVYFSVLITHIVLAALVPPLALITLIRGLSARYDKHRRVARWTLPIWLYVSVTGVIVYLMLYQTAAGLGQVRGPIVFISIDTLRADRLPLYGSTRIRTPNIDRLAADGVVFENAYSHSPQTLPSHTSILSGELPFEHGVRDNIGFNVKTGQRFLQHDLKEAGYATGGFVSAYVLREQTGFNQGFDTFDDELPPASPEEPLAQVQRGGEQTMAAAMKWIDEQAGRQRPEETEAGGLKPEAGSQFFLFAHIYEPHAPYTPPARFAKADPYDGEVEYADEIAGKLLDHLRARNLYDQATIVLLADHGEGLGDHGEEEHGIFLYRETTHVPLIVKLPGSRSASRRISTPVQHIDLVPTVLELVGRLKPAPAATTAPSSAEAGVSRPERRELRGRSLLHLLEGSGDIAPTNIYSEALSPRYHFGWSELYALSDERYRFIRAPKDELYDLAQDAKELKSIAEERPQVRSAMRGALEQMIAASGVTAPSAISASDREKLAALGYVGTQSGPSVELAGDRLPDPKDRIEILRMYRQATRLSTEGKLTEAVALFRRLLDDDPGMGDVSLQLAETYNRQGQIENALGAFKQVIARDPKNPAALTGATSALLRLGRIDEAKAHAELAAPVAPAIAHEMLARIAVHQKDETAARRHARLAQQADPTLPMVAFIDGMILHQRGQFAQSAQRLLEAKRAMVSRTEQLADLNYLAADSLARLERYAEAEQLFRAELLVFPSHVRARAGLAMLYKATGRDTEAERAVEEIVRLSPTREGLDTAAQLWTMFGEPARAAQVRARMRQPPGQSR
jgi:choline-sulfatase